MKKHKIPQGAKVFGVLGRLSYEKAVDLAIEAFEELVKRNRGKELYLVIMGVGPEEKKLKRI